MSAFQDLNEKVFVGELTKTFSTSITGPWGGHFLSLICMRDHTLSSRGSDYRG